MMTRGPVQVIARGARTSNMRLKSLVKLAYSVAEPIYAVTMDRLSQHDLALSLKFQFTLTA
jgi:hypothetical protein